MRRHAREKGGPVSRFSAFPRAAILAAALAVLALGLFSASAVSWSGGEENGGNEETTPVETGPTGPVGATGQTGPQGTEQTQPTEQAPQETQPAEQQPVHAFSPTPAPESAPATPKGNIEVKGETGTRGKSNSGDHSGGPVIAQAPSSTEVAAASTTPSGGKLANTGFNAMAMILLGGISLAGSALLFWRARTI
jgi:LPXTG-motif cell wall-anchored protein